MREGRKIKRVRGEKGEWNKQGVEEEVERK